MLIALVLMVVPLILFVFMKSGQKVTVFPKDFFGRSSVAPDIVYFVFFFPIALLTEPDELNPVLAAALTTTPAAACVTGAISMIKSKETCILAFLSTTFGLGLPLGAIGLWFI